MAAKLKILQLTNRIYWPLNDGGNIVTYHLMSALKKRGHELIVCSLNTNKHHQNPEVLQHLGKIYSTDINTDIKAIDLFKSIFSSFPYNVKRFYDKSYEALLIKVVQEEKPDIIQLEGAYMSMYAQVLRPYTQAPIVLRSHNIEHEIWQRLSLNEKNPIKKIYLQNLWPKIKTFEESFKNTYQGILAITDRDAEYYRRNQFQSKITTIPGGIPLESTERKYQHIPIQDLCFIGSMEWFPNTEGIQWFEKSVLPLIRLKRPDIKLHVAGKNTPTHLIGKEINGIHYHGMVDSSKAFLQAHGLMVVPLLSGGGMRFKIVEAMSYGKCIVSTSIGAEGIAYQNGSDIHLYDTAEKMSEGILSLLDHPEKIKSTENQAQNTAYTKYDIEKLAQETENFYIELL